LSREALIDALEVLLPGRRELHEELEIAVLQRIAGEQPVDAFGLRVGHWRIDLPTRLMQTAVSAAVLGGAIAATGEVGVPAAVLALVLPFLVDVERIEVRTRDRIVRAYLSDPDVLDDPEAAYAALPDDLREQLTLLEFADTLDRLRLAGGLSDDDPAEVSVELPPPAAEQT
jgi:hypothetical protein